MLRSALIIGFIVSSTTIAFGSLWESPNWALLGTVAVSTGYDSDLTLLHDGPGGFFIVGNPSIEFTRKSSDSDIEVTGGVSRDQFLSGNQPSETDLSLGTVISYPNDKTAIPIYYFNASLLKSSQPNQFLGERIAFDQIDVSGEVNQTLTGKLGVTVSTELDSLKYDAVSLNDYLHGGVVVGITYLKSPGTLFSINFGTFWGNSAPNDPTQMAVDVRSKEYDLTARLRGQITEKVTGNIYGGYGLVDYTGGYSNQNNIPVAGADLTWALDPRRTVVLAAYSGATNIPDGTAVDTSHAFLSYTDVILSEWQFTIRVGPTRSVFNRKVVERRDDSWDYGTELAYQPSKQFRIALDLSYSRRNSDVSAYQYNHELLSLSTTYSF